MVLRPPRVASWSPRAILAVAADVARFGTSGINVGLFCTSPGVALSRNVGRKAAMEMLLTGGLIDAPTALARGLINRVVAAEKLDEELAVLLASITNKSPLAVAMGKRAFYEQLEMGVDAAYQLAAESMACNMLACRCRRRHRCVYREASAELARALRSSLALVGRRQSQVPTVTAITASTICSQGCSRTTQIETHIDRLIIEIATFLVRSVSARCSSHSLNGWSKRRVVASRR
jgi:hypothetical protein